MKQQDVVNNTYLPRAKPVIEQDSEVEATKKNNLSKRNSYELVSKF